MEKSTSEEDYLMFMFLDKCNRCSTKTTSSWLRVLDDVELELLKWHAESISSEKWEGTGWSFEFFYGKAYNSNVEIGNVSLKNFFYRLGKYFDLIVALIKFEDEDEFITKKLKTRNKLKIIEKSSDRFVVLVKEEINRRSLNLSDNLENIGKITSDISLNKQEDMKNAKNILKQIFGQDND